MFDHFLGLVINVLKASRSHIYQIYISSTRWQVSKKLHYICLIGLLIHLLNILIFFLVFFLSFLNLSAIIFKIFNYHFQHLSMCGIRIGKNILTNFTENYNFTKIKYCSIFPKRSIFSHFL